MLFSVGICLAAPVFQDRSPGSKLCWLEWVFFPLPFNSPSVHPGFYHTTRPSCLLLVSSFVYIFLCFSQPPTAMLWNTEQQLIFYQRKFCLKWLLRRKIREGGITGAGRLACAVTWLSRICISKTFSLLSSTLLFMEL